MTNDCILDVAVATPTTIAVDVSSGTIAVAVTNPTTIEVAVTSTVVAVAVTAPTTIGVAVTSTAISVAVIQPSEIEVAVLDMGTVASALLNSIEEGAMRDRQDAKKLAAWTTAFAIHAVAPGTFVELPTALVSYPSFRGDCGWIEWKVGFSHQLMNATTVSFTMFAGPAGNLANVLFGQFITSPAFAAGAGALTGELVLRLTPRSAVAQSIWASLSWRDGAAVNNYIVFPTRPNPFIDFGNVANTDNGDVEMHLECSISANGAGQTFNVNSVSCFQYGQRSGS